MLYCNYDHQYSKRYKTSRNRVGLTLNSVKNLVDTGNEVIIGTNAGNGSGFQDSYYLEEGMKIIYNTKEIFEHAETIVKAKESQSQAVNLLKKGQNLSQYLAFIIKYEW